MIQHKYLTLVHVLLITISNILVQYPFVVFGFHTTWGAISYPVIFILTDLTSRIFDAEIARNIIFRSMFPGLIISYAIASFIEIDHLSLDSILVIHQTPLRVAFACFIAYAVGQLLDIQVFQRYRNHSSWWLAPAISTTIGNIIDTILFFSIAFYRSENMFLSLHWPEIAMIDALFKMSISLLALVPIYGYLLNMMNIRTLGTSS